MGTGWGCGMADRSTEATPPGDEIRALTGARGVAACWVMAYHTAYAYPSTTALGRLIHHGYLAVDFFFLLSGFVLARGHGARFAAGCDAAAYGDFLRRRLARIYPLYGAAILLLVLAARAAPPATLAANLLMVQSWGAGWPSLDGPGWSISCEWLAYLLFPLLCRGFLGARATRAGALAAVAAMIVAALAALPPRWIGAAPPRVGPLDIWTGIGPGPALRCLAEFGIGIVLHRTTHAPLGVRLRGAGALWTAVAAAALAVLCLPGTDLAVVALFAALVLGLSGERGAIARLLGAAPVAFLGTISYSIYLAHAPMLAAWQHAFTRDLPPLPAAARVAIAWASILLVASASHYGLERPARRAIAASRLPSRPRLDRPAPGR